MTTMEPNDPQPENSEPAPAVPEPTGDEDLDTDGEPLAAEDSTQSPPDAV
jgi:hypothetical protein